MRNTGKVLAVLWTLVFVIALMPATVYAAPPTIDEGNITLIPLDETTAAISLPFGDAQTMYWLLREGADSSPSPEDANALKAAPTGSVSHSSFPNASIEFSGLTPHAEYVVWLASENADGELSELVRYPFTQLSPPPELAIDTVAPVSLTAAQATYTVYGTAQTVYWLLLSEGEGTVDGDTMPTHEKTQSFSGGAGTHTLNLTDLTPNTDYTLYMMARDEDGQFSDPYSSFSFSMTPPAPTINSVSVFGVSSTAATAEAVVDFGGLGGTVSMLLLSAAEPSPDDDALAGDPRTTAIACDASEGVVVLPLTGMMAETAYIACFLAESDGGRARWDTVPFTTLPSGGGELPVIAVSPANASIENGVQAVFTVQASGSELQYQWQCTHAGYGSMTWPGGLAWEMLDDAYGTLGANTATLTVSETVSDEWYNTAFRCIVTNAAGSAISDYAVLTVQGRWPILKSVCEVDVEPHHPIGQGQNAGNRFEAVVTVPYTTTAIEGTDFSVDAASFSVSSPLLFSDKNYTAQISSQPLSVGANDVYFTMFVASESNIYYHVVVTREDDPSGSGDDPSGGEDDPSGSEDDPSGSEDDPSDGGDGPSGDEDDGGSGEGSGGSFVPTEEASASIAPITPNIGVANYYGIPQTGDYSDIGVWYILLGVSILGIAGAALLYRRWQ